MTRQRLSPGPAAALLAAAGFAALLADRLADGRRRSRSSCSSSACGLRPSGAASISSARSSTGLGVFILSPFLWSSPEGTVLWEGPTIPVARAARRDDGRAVRGGPERIAAHRARAGVLGLCAAARPRPARGGGRLRPPVGAGGRARDAARAVARAGRRRARGGGAGPRRQLLEGARGLRDAALAARRRLARAGDEPGRGDGGTRLRASRVDARAAAAWSGRDRLRLSLAAVLVVAGGAQWL